MAAATLLSAAAKLKSLFSISLFVLLLDLLIACERLDGTHAELVDLTHPHGEFPVYHRHVPGILVGEHLAGPVGQVLAQGIATDSLQNLLRQNEIQTRYQQGKKDCSEYDLHRAVVYLLLLPED